MEEVGLRLVRRRGFPRLGLMLLLDLGMPLESYSASGKDAWIIESVSVIASVPDFFRAMVVHRFLRFLVSLKLGC